MHAFLLDTYQKMELLGHTAGMCLVGIQFFKVFYHFIFYQQVPVDYALAIT